MIPIFSIRVHLLVCGLFAVYLTPSSGQYIENPQLFFKDMTHDAFDKRLRGSFKTPLCVKLMMNCWEVMTGGTLCNEQGLYVGSACTNMRTHRCTDMFPWGQHGYPYTWMQMLDEVCPGNGPIAPADSRRHWP